LKKRRRKRKRKRRRKRRRNKSSGRFLWRTYTDVKKKRISKITKMITLHSLVNTF